jgi:hypothetical protein
MSNLLVLSNTCGEHGLQVGRLYTDDGLSVVCMGVATHASTQDRDPWPRAFWHKYGF